MRSRHLQLVFATFTALALFWTWPLASHLSSRVPNDPGDPVLNIWILWWNAQVLPLTDRWWNPPIFVPLDGSLTLSEHLLGLSVFATPLQLVGASPLAAYNVLLIGSYALSGFFAYLLALRLTGSKLAAACAGVAFGFTPYRAGHLAHIQVLTSQWMPLMLLGMHAYVETGQRKWLGLFAASWLLQSLSNGYYLLFVPVLIAPWIAWFVPWRTSPRRGIALLATWVLASVPLVPVLLKYHAVHSALGFSRSLEDIRRFSATWESLATVPPGLLLWPAGLAVTTEGYLFPGLIVLVVAAAGIVGAAWAARGGAATRETRGIARTIVFYAGMAVVMYLLALGPGGEADGPPSWLRPYTWLLSLPGYNGLRVPARFAMPATLCLALGAACAIGWFVRGGERLRTFFGAAALVGLALEGIPEPIPLVPPPQRLALTGIEGAKLLEVPVDAVRVNVAAMYRSIYHGLPLINGYSGYIPHHIAILSRALWLDDPTALDYFAQDGPLVVVVNRRGDRGGAFLRSLRRRPDLTPLGTDGVGQAFLLPRQPWRPPVISETSLRPGSTRRTDPRVLDLDLGSPRRVDGIEFALRGRYPDIGERMAIEASADGEAWRQVWLGWTGALALDATLRDPLAAPLRIGFPPERTRYLRVYPAPRWMEEEIKVAVAEQP